VNIEMLSQPIQHFDHALRHPRLGHAEQLRCAPDRDVAEDDKNEHRASRVIERRLHAIERDAAAQLVHRGRGRSGARPVHPCRLPLGEAGEAEPGAIERGAQPVSRLDVLAMKLERGPWRRMHHRSGQNARWPWIVRAVFAALGLSSSGSLHSARMALRLLILMAGGVSAASDGSGASVERLLPRRAIWHAGS